MRTNAAQKYPKLEILTGGQCPLRGRRRGKRVRTAAEHALDREYRGDFVMLVDPSGNVPSEGIQRVRIGVQHPWRVIARRIVEARVAKVEHERVRQIGVRLIAWIDELYDVQGAA